MVTRVLLALLLLTGVASAQAKLEVGIYAPSVEFGTAQARLAYVQGLAKAIEQATGISTVAQSYASIAALKKGNPDFAIVEGVCYAINPSWQLLANAEIGGSTSRPWALFSNGIDSMQGLRGKKLAYMATGCNDAGFIDNAMLDSEVTSGFFGPRDPARDVTGAVAAVQSYKTAQAVFAPTSVAKGLTKVFDTGNVPNPAFVQLNRNLPGGTSGKVASAVLSYGGSGAISGWSRPSADVYQALRGSLGPKRKTPTFATPEPARISHQGVLNDPASIRDPAFVGVRHHWQPGRMD
jgi:hypothetical protein